MRSNDVLITTPAASAYPWLPVDHHGDGLISYNIIKGGTGDITISLQGTLSNMDEVSAVAFDIVSGKTISFASNFAFPVAAVRLNITAVSGAGSVRLQTMQAG